MLYILSACDVNDSNNIIIDYLKNFNLTHNLYTMASDKLITNATIGYIFRMSQDISFDHNTQVHGCVAHTINGAANRGPTGICESG